MAWYDIKIPLSLKPYGNDFVNYKVTPKPGLKSPYLIPSEKKDAPCYSSHMANLSDYEFLCSPSRTSSLLDSDLYEKWIEYGKIYNLIPQNAVTECKNGYNSLRIPAANNKHQVYAALCFHRWAENQPQMVYLALKLVEGGQPLHFFQAMHYAMSRHRIINNHSFCNIVQVYYHYDKNKAYLYYSLVGPVAIAAFFRPRENEPLGYAGKYTAYFGTAFVIDIEIRNKWMGCTPPVQDPAKKEPTCPDLYVREIEHILWPEWYEMYTTAKPHRDDLVKLYKEVMLRKGFSQ